MSKRPPPVPTARAFTEGNNIHGFLFASLDDETLPKRGLLLKERICSSRSKFFHFRVDTQLRREVKMNDRVVSPESEPVHLYNLYL